MRQYKEMIMSKFQPPIFIENVSWDDIKHGWHYDCGGRAVLIQIADPASFFPTPKHKFEKVFQFEFLDLEGTEGYGEEFLITNEQAAEIVKILEEAMAECRNVVVHCFAGICRSGAVVEVASMMGFTPTERFRMPNMLVKHKLMRALGWYYDDETR